MTTLDYYDPESLSTAFYDVVAHFDPTLEGDIAFYEQLIPQGSWVLELGCGAGRVGLPLAVNERAVVGLDLSAAMLAKGQAKRARLAPEVIQRTAFVHGDMTGFSLKVDFDAVIAPFFGFSHLSAGVARRKAFKAIARHLKPGGLVAIHAILPDLAAAPVAVDPQRAVLDVEYEADGKRLRLYVPGQSFDAETGRFEQLLDYVMVAPDGAETRRSRERLVYYASDLAAEAKGAGLTLSEKISPFNQVGEMWVFRKA